MLDTTSLSSTSLGSSSSTYLSTTDDYTSTMDDKTKHSYETTWSTIFKYYTLPRAAIIKPQVFNFDQKAVSKISSVTTNTIIKEQIFDFKKINITTNSSSNITVLNSSNSINIVGADLDFEQNGSADLNIYNIANETNKIENFEQDGSDDVNINNIANETNKVEIGKFTLLGNNDDHESNSRTKEIVLKFDQKYTIANDLENLKSQNNGDMKDSKLVISFGRDKKIEKGLIISRKGRSPSKYDECDSDALMECATKFVNNVNRSKSTRTQFCTGYDKFKSCMAGEITKCGPTVIKIFNSKIEEKSHYDYECATYNAGKR
ncbi:unnamed protein product [Gordionus sp. m RMFG-2023]